MVKFRLPSEIPLEEYPPPSAFIEEAISCVEDAEKEGIILRIMGGLAIYLHSQKYKELWKRLSRLGGKVFTDIDFASYGKFRRKVSEFFTKRGYDFDPKQRMLYGSKRHIYFGGKVPMIEVFFDKLEMNHTIKFSKRLEADYPTIPLAELLLEKIQIVYINDKDIKDSVVLLIAHNIGETDDDTINLKVLAQSTCSDWGFYYTATTNLKKIKNFAIECEALSEKDKKDINNKIEKIIAYLEDQPKTLSWKLRSKIGTRKKWYNDVEDWSFFRANA